MNLQDEIEKMKERLLEDRRTLHQMPEIGFDLDQTCAFIKKRLVALGYVPHDIGNHGIYTTIGEGTPCILLRADMDGLPIKEESGLPFSSTNNHAHACGHDLHMTMLLGACALFKKMKKINGTIKILFQPSEENASGAKAMIEAGILENPHVDTAFSMHIKADQKTGTIHYCPGTLMASSDFFKVVIRGQSAHGSAPHEGIDPIAIAAHTIVNLEMISSREINAKDRFTMTFGKVEAGKANNIIPDEAILEGSIRCFDPDVRVEVLERFEDIISATSDMYNAKSRVDYPMRALPVYNDPKMVKQLTPALKEIAEVDEQCEPLSISEDFSYYSEKVPSLFVLVGAQGDDEPISLHNSAIVFDEKGMKTGILAYVQVATTYLKGTEL